MQPNNSENDMDVFLPIRQYFPMGKKKYPPNRLKEIREARGPAWTQEYVADLLDTTPATISRLEGRTRQLNSEWLEKFTRIYRCTVADIFKGGPARSAELERVIGLYEALSDEQRRLWFQLGDALIGRRSARRNRGSSPEQ